MMSVPTSFATASSAANADERRQIEAAADLYETMALGEDGEESEVMVMMASGLCKETLSGAAADAYAGRDELEERPTRSASSASTSSYQEDEMEGETGEVMAEDPQPTRDLLVKTLEEEEHRASEVLKRLSFGLLSDKEPLSAAPMEKPTTSGADVSRSIMFSRYARVVPSAQESQPSRTPFGAGMHLPKAELSLSMATINGCPPLLTLFTTPSTDPLGCCSVSCQEQAKWKDERIHELQRALDHMVDAMVIQQRDMVVQRAFLARQSEQLTKLSMTLHQEKLSLQIERERERAQKAARAATLSPAFASSSRPSTPSGKVPRSPRGTSKSKASMKAIFSKVAGSSSSSSRRDSGRRSTVSSIDEHAVVAPMEMVYSPTPLSANPVRSASASQLAQVVLTASARDAAVNDNVRDAPLHDHSDDDISNTFATEVERSMSLSALEIRATQPVLTSSSSSNAIKTPPPMSDVSLQDSPVRFGSRSATNCVKLKERQKEQPASPLSLVTATSGFTAAAAANGESKKPSLGERFRSLHWKS